MKFLGLTQEKFDKLRADIPDPNVPGPDHVLIWPKSDTCERCGKTAKGIGLFALAFRKLEAKKGNPDPGNCCGSCAGEIAGRRIADPTLRGEAI